MNTENEIWKSVPGVIGVEASSLGRVRRGLKVKASSLTGKGYKHGRGYLATRIGDKLMKVHRLVALAFHPNPSGLPQVNHKDGSTTNNRPENLEWCDQFKNMRHAVDSGLKIAVHGASVGTSFLTEDKVRAIFEAAQLSQGSYSSIGERFGISGVHVNRIAHGLSWGHLNLLAR